jgi:hypothetical protein
MAMQALGGSKDIEFNSDLISEAMLQRWAALKVPPRLLAAAVEDVSWLRDAMASPAFAQNDVAAFYDEAQMQAAVKEAVDTVSASDEFRPMLMAAPAGGGGSSSDQVAAAVKAALMAPAPDDALAKTNFGVLDSIRTSTDANGMFECNVGGVPLLRANTLTATGRSASVVLKVAAVFMDIVTVVMAAAGILAQSGSSLAQRFMKFVDKISDWFMKMMETLWGRLAKVISNVKLAAGESSKVFTVVKNGAKDVAAAVVAVVGWAKNAGKWAEFKSACQNAIGVMLDSGWKKFLACCQLIASMILLCVSGGTSLVLKIIALVAGLVSLVLDSIDLYNLTHPA